jgi:hypothetical protein
MHPQPRVRNKIKHTSVVTTVTPESPGIPRAMVLTVSFVLSPVTGLFCHRHPADNSAELDSSVGASGPHDFAVHLKRRSSYSTISVHRIPPRVRDDRASAPLWDETVSDILLIWVCGEAKFFYRWGWTGFSDLPVRLSSMPEPHGHMVRSTATRLPKSNQAIAPDGARYFGLLSPRSPMATTPTLPALCNSHDWP